MEQFLALLAAQIVVLLAETVVRQLVPQLSSFLGGALRVRVA